MAAADKRAAIVDAHHHGLAVIAVGHADLGAKWQRLMRRGHRVHIEAFAIGGQPPVETPPVIAGNAVTQRADLATGRSGLWLGFGLGFSLLDRGRDGGDVHRLALCGGVGGQGFKGCEAARDIAAGGAGCAVGALILREQGSLIGDGDSQTGGQANRRETGGANP